MIKPSLWFILLVPLKALAIVAILTLVLTIFPFQITLGLTGRGDLALICLMVFIARFFWQFLAWLGQVYILTDRRIVRVSGVLHIKLTEVHLTQISQTHLNFSTRERLFRLGTINITCHDANIPHPWWPMVAKPHEIHQTVCQTVKRYR